MDRCPPDDTLRAFLDGAAPPAGVDVHVEACPACQRRLEELIATPLADRLRATPPTADSHPSLLAVSFLGRVLGHVPASPRPPESLALPGYEIRGVLGRGGLGVVYEALDTRLRRTVAVKMLLGGAFARPDARMRFLIEAEAVARLRHRGIVQVFEFGEADGLPFLAMEYVAGGTLARRLAVGPRPSPRQAAALLLEMTAAVAAAHRAGVIHRDLKPANVLLDNSADGPADDGLGRPKITDFGLARIEGHEVTRTGTVMGTPAYMAPEQAAGDQRRTDTRADVYSLGAVLYEVLTGKPPFDGETAIDVLQQVIHIEPRPPRSLVATLPRDLDVICRTCLAKDPARRYASADALADDLRAYLDGRPIAARPVSRWERSVRFVRRHPWPAAAVFMLVFVSAVAFVLVNAARVDERNQRRQADQRLLAAQAARRGEEEARARAERAAAEVAFDRAVLRCEAGDIDAGVLGLEDAGQSAEGAGDGELARIARANATAWRARQPVLVHRYPAATDQQVNAAAFGADGTLVVVGDGRTAVARAWPVPPPPGGRPLFELRPPRTLFRNLLVTDVVPTSAGKMYVGYESGTVRRIDAATGAADGSSIDIPIGTTLGTVALHPEKDRLLIAYTNGQIALYDVKTGQRQPRGFAHRIPLGRDATRRAGLPVSDKPTFAPNAPAVEPTAVLFADAASVLTAARLGGVQLHSLDSGQVTAHFDTGTEVFRIAVSADGQYLLAGGETATSLWAIRNPSRPLWVHQHPRRAGAVAFSPDGHLCVIGDHAGNVACRERATGHLTARFRYTAAVRVLAFHPSEPLLLVGGENSAIDLWRLPPRRDRDFTVSVRMGPPRDVIPIGSTASQVISAVGFWPTGADVWMVNPQGFMRWAMSPPRLVGERLIVNNERRAAGSPRSRGVRTGVLASDGRLAVTGGWDRLNSAVWDLSGPTPIAHNLNVVAAQVGLLPDNRSIFAVGDDPAEDTAVHWWKWADGKISPDRLDWPPLRAPVVMAPSPDGATVLVGTKVGEPTGLRDARTGRMIVSLPHPATVSVVTAVAVHHSGQFAATGGNDGSLRVWSLPDGQLLGRPAFHSDLVTQLVFGRGAADGVLVSTSYDRTARVWDFRRGLPLTPPIDHAEPVLSLAVSPDGRALTGSKDGTVHNWEILK